ncbi:nucleoid-associated protein [Paraglaciecola sp. 25GB23A]|uniref:nucleoid-associated protein n=1 Tax=Paraglaciecola sp. 25GB23A TaxID=3156068 RepID=UPI0032AFF0A3
MDIKNLVVHEVRKSKDASGSILHLREKENIANEHAKTLVSQLSQLFRKTGLNTGQFSVPEDPNLPKPAFMQLVESQFKNSKFTDFIEFSRSATRLFKTFLDESGSSKGGYLWLNHYTHNDDHFLSIVLLRKKYGIALTEELDLGEIEQLDLDTLHMAARINLNAWLNEVSNRYIAFRIGRNAKDVTDYFSKFIGCEEFIKARADTQNLVQVTKKYCAAHSFDEFKTEQVKQRVLEQCLNWIDNEEFVKLDKLSSILDESFLGPENDNTGIFLEIAQNEPYCLTNDLMVERSVLRGLTRYSGKNKNLSISFDSELLNTTVFFDSTKGELRFTALPDALVEQLRSEKNDLNN